MAVAKPQLTPVEELRQQAGESRRSQALDGTLLRVVGELKSGDFDEVAAQVSDDPTLRDGLSAWLVSARARGLVEHHGGDGRRPQISLTPDGRALLGAGG